MAVAADQRGFPANSLAEPLGLTLPMKPDLCHFSRSQQAAGVGSGERSALR